MTLYLRQVTPKVTMIMILSNITYDALDDNSIFKVLKYVEQGIDYSSFKKYASKLGFTLSDWSDFLHLSERTFQRYEKEQRSFDTLQSQQLVELAMVINHGKGVFGSIDTFKKWLELDCIALANTKPKSLLTTSLGINIVHDELGRIEHGILA